VRAGRRSEKRETSRCWRTRKGKREKAKKKELSKAKRISEVVKTFWGEGTRARERETSSVQERMGEEKGNENV